MRGKTRPLLLCLPIAILTACSGAAPEDDSSGGTGGGGSGVGGTSSANGGSGANGVGGTGAAGSSGSGPSVTAPEIFAALAGEYEADFSSATAIVCGSLLPILGGTADPILSGAGVDCGNAGLHRVEVTETGTTRFLDTAEAIEFVWDNRSRELPPSDTRLSGGVEYVVGEGVCCIERYIERNLTLMYPSADDLTFNLLSLTMFGNMMPDNGEAAAPLTRIE